MSLHRPFDAPLTRWNMDSPENTWPHCTPYNPPMSCSPSQTSRECAMPAACRARYPAVMAGVILYWTPLGQGLRAWSYDLMFTFRAERKVLAVRYRQQHQVVRPHKCFRVDLEPVFVARLGGVS